MRERKEEMETWRRRRRSEEEDRAQKSFSALRAAPRPLCRQQAAALQTGGRADGQTNRHATQLLVSSRLQRRPSVGSNGRAPASQGPASSHASGHRVRDRGLTSPVKEDKTESSAWQSLCVLGGGAFYLFIYYIILYCWGLFVFVGGGFRVGLLGQKSALQIFLVVIYPFTG